jgi:hypothetical protein
VKPRVVGRWSSAGALDLVRALEWHGLEIPFVVLAQFSHGFTGQDYAARPDCAAYPYDQYPWS